MRYESSRNEMTERVALLTHAWKGANAYRDTPTQQKFISDAKIYWNIKKAREKNTSTDSFNTYSIKSTIQAKSKRLTPNKKSQDDVSRYVKVGSLFCCIVMMMISFVIASRI